MASRGARGGRGKWRPPAKGGFIGFGEEKQEANIPFALIKQARQNGQLNLSNRDLEKVPPEVWRINIDVPEEGKHISLDLSGDRWWEQVDLKKLILASNRLKELSTEIQNLPALTVLDVHDNSLESLPEEVGELRELCKLHLSHNKLTSLPKSFCKLELLQSLLLSNNSLQSLPEEFSYLINLEELDISENKLTALPDSFGTFGSFKNLKKLNLSNNQLKCLPSGLTNLKAVRDLNLSYNKLTEMPEGLDGMKSLDILDCKYNQITSFRKFGSALCVKEMYFGCNKISVIDGETLQYLTSLVILDLRDNVIEKLPDEITLLMKLERLDLTNNNLSCLPFVMGNMQLKSLALEGNSMRGLRRDIVARGAQGILAYLKTRLPAPVSEINANTIEDSQSIGTMIPSKGDKMEILDTHIVSKTKAIDLSNKKMNSIPDEIWSINNEISIVNLSKNQLEEVPLSLTRFTDSLKDLNISSNKLTCLPKEIGLLTRLTYLDLSNNMISSLPEEIGSCHCLSQITLSVNRFTLIPPTLYTISGLEAILISGNQVNNIDVDGLMKLPNLLTLDLSNNNIASVPPELGNVASLRSLTLGGNAFRNPRPAILAKGTQQLLDYLRDRIPR